MTHIEQMIQDLCPNGVEWKTLGEVCTCTKGQQLNKSGLLEEGYPVINGGINPSGYWNEYNYPANTITISQGGASAGYVNYVQTPFWAGAHCYVLIDVIPEINYKFLYYLVKQSESTLMQCQYGAGIPALGAKTVSALEIPLPPLEIQKKIVECLDKFSALAAELQAELQKRRTQYEYYRTRLLTPPPTENISSDNSTDESNWEWKTLGEICEILRGKRLTKSELSATEQYPVFHGGIEPLGNYKSYNREANTVMVINVGASAGTIGYCDKKFWSSDGCFCLSHVDCFAPKYLYYYLQTREKELKSRVRYAGIPTLDSIEIKKLLVPVPPIEEQERIVSILDRFEKLITSMEDGIPAEQAAQQKRYEYYRDLLLTFDRKNV